MWLPSFDQLLLITFHGLLAWAALSDARTFTIPNRISLALLGFYPAWVVANWPTIDPLGGLIVGAGVLLAGFLLFAMGWLGGGDVKLLAALAVWAGPEHTLHMLFITALAGGGLAAAIALTAAYRRWAATIPGLAGTVALPVGQLKMPYGVGIACGGVYLALTLFGPI